MTQNPALIVEFLNSEAATLYEYGRDRGSNVHLAALIALRRTLLASAASAMNASKARNNLGTALMTLGDRESGTARLEEAVEAYRDALKEYTREDPLGHFPNEALGDRAGARLRLGIVLHQQIENCGVGGCAWQDRRDWQRRSRDSA